MYETTIKERVRFCTRIVIKLYTQESAQQMVMQVPLNANELYITVQISSRNLSGCLCWHVSHQLSVVSDHRSDYVGTCRTSLKTSAAQGICQQTTGRLWQIPNLQFLLNITASECNCFSVNPCKMGTNNRYLTGLYGLCEILN